MRVSLFKKDVSGSLLTLRPALMFFRSSLPGRWKAERRKHFPTRENLAKREAEGKARAERGEQELQR